MLIASLVVEAHVAHVGDAPAAVAPLKTAMALADTCALVCVTVDSSGRYDGRLGSYSIGIHLRELALHVITLFPLRPRADFCAGLLHYF